MITQADDEGRLVADLEQLRVLIFGYHLKVTRRDLASAREELQQSELLKIYSVNGTDYAWFPSWQDHQRIDRPTPSKLPPYTSLDESSRVLDESSRVLALEGKGREGKGEEGNGHLVGHARQRDENLILDFLNRKAEKNFQPTDSNLDLIRGRLKDGATPDQIRAVVGLRVQKWKGTDMDEYLRPSTIFNKTKFAQYLGQLPASAFEPESNDD